MLEELLTDLKAASQSAVNEAMITRGSAWIEALKREHPLVHTLITNLLYETPEKVLHTLGMWNKDIKLLETNEHALAYVSALQARLRGGKDK